MGETHPKVFVSYSWTNQAHQQWVLNLATELRDSGVDVVLDVWDLREGHDAVKFMEQMVINPEVQKVIIISDQKYVERADDRVGGVGTETQIISRQVYENQEQDKFVVAVVENDLQGNPCVPTYAKSRIHFDFTNPEEYPESFEALLRWIYGQPLHVKPKLGKKPSFLENDNTAISLGTSAISKRAVLAVKEGKAFASGSVDEYLETFTSHLERFRIEDGIDAQKIIDSIDQFHTSRNEVVSVLITVARYSTDPEYIEKIHRFVERLIPYMYRPEQQGSWSTWGFDNFRFIVYELYLYIVAIFLKYEKFEAASYLMSQPFYVHKHPDFGRDESVFISEFMHSLPSIESWYQEQDLNKLCPSSDLLKKRCDSGVLEFRYIIQADFVLYIKAELCNWHWYPETMVYAQRQYAPFEIFSRSVSRQYFDRMKCIFKIDAPCDLEPLLLSFQSGERRAPAWRGRGFSPMELLGYKDLASTD